jgi:hypothetical protein
MARHHTRESLVRGYAARGGSNRYKLKHAAGVSGGMDGSIDADVCIDASDMHGASIHVWCCVV